MTAPLPKPRVQHLPESTSPRGKWEVVGVGRDGNTSSANFSTFREAHRYIARARGYVTHTARCVTPRPAR